jgi:uncharacterized protein (TIGR00255 family)
MTGYGRGAHAKAGCGVTVEIRSVNRKQAEIQLDLPHELEPLEVRIREVMAKAVARGRCEVHFAVELPPTAVHARVNHALAKAYAHEFTRLAGELNLPATVSLELLARCPGVIQGADPFTEVEPLWPVVRQALDKALETFTGMRDKEGAHLAKDLTARISQMRKAVARIAKQAPMVQKRFRDQLLLRIQAAGLESISAEDERVVKEVVVFADRADISEELARLASHFDQFDGCTDTKEPVGRKLDFLAQEMNREINTIGSKANDALISSDVVLLKTELERFREQAQNVE